MKKYLINTVEDFKALVKGMKSNPADWTNTPVKPTDVETMETELEDKGQQVDTAEATASQARHTAMEKNSEAKKMYEQVVNLAYGIYANNPEKLSEYGIKLKRESTKIPPPTAVLSIEIKDDTDGEGFVLSVVQRDEVADSYEWQKGPGADPKDLNTIPPLQFFKVTSKTTFLDDQIQKGVRYFYRVRAVNRNGQGPWSEPTSQVQ